MRIKYFILLISSFIFSRSLAQNEKVILIPMVKASGIIFDTLIGNKSGYKLKNYNIFFESGIQSKFLIHLVIFSDSTGIFKKEKVIASKSKNVNIIHVSSLFSTAKENVRRDQQRDISFFEYNFNDYQKYPLIENDYKIMEEDKDGSLWLYNDPSLIFYYEIRAYKQFTPLQSCASLINVNAIEQPMERMYEEFRKDNLIVSNIKSKENLDYYLSNKIILEKKNSDSSYHFVKFRIHCFDCKENDFEFDYNETKGIKRLWFYIPKEHTKQRQYVRFSKN